MDSIYPLGETPSYTAALYKLLCQIPFYLKKNNYWWEGSISTAIQLTFAAGFMDQYNKIGGIIFGLSLVYSIKLIL